jgi:hypothetical protein
MNPKRHMKLECTLKRSIMKATFILNLIRLLWFLISSRCKGVWVKSISQILMLQEILWTFTCLILMIMTLSLPNFILV